MTSWSDHPIQRLQDDSLDRKAIIDSLKRLFTESCFASPLAVGIYGDWGSGKTSVMRALVHELHSEHTESRKNLVLWFDAWKYARSEQALWRALLLSVVETLADPKTGIPSMLPEQEAERQKLFHDEIETLRTSLYRTQASNEAGSLHINWGSILSLALDIGIRFAGAGIIGKLDVGRVLDRVTGRDTEKAARLFERTAVTRYREQIQSTEQFQMTLEDLVRREVNGRGLSLFVFVDDLDRCLPEEAVGALEAVKLFMDIEGCVFVLGMDRDVVERGILVRYPPVVEADGSVRLRVDPRQYLDKIIQLPFTLPPLTRTQIKTYLGSLLSSDPSTMHLQGCRSLIEMAAPPNPRTLKRILNVLALIASMDRTNNATDHAEAEREFADRTLLLAKIVLLQILFDDAYAASASDPRNLIHLEKAAQDMAGGEDMKRFVDAKPPLRRMLCEPPFFSECPIQTLWELLCHAEITAPSPALAPDHLAS